MNNFEKFFVRNAPSIFTGLAIAGVGLTAYLAYKSASAIAEEVEANTELMIESAGEKPVYSLVEPEKKEKAIIYAKHIWPTILTGVATIYCVYEANNINARREAILFSALAGAYEYREEVKKAIGEKKEQKIYDQIKTNHTMEDILNRELPPFEPDEGKVWCYEPVTKQFFKCTKERLMWAEMNLNKELNGPGWGIQFDDFLSYLGIDGNKDSAPLGWWSSDTSGFWDYNWSYFAAGGNPWVVIRQNLITIDNREVIELIYDVNPDINPDVNVFPNGNGEEPEQFIVEDKTKKKAVVVKH